MDIAIIVANCLAGAPAKAALPDDSVGPVLLRLAAAFGLFAALLAGFSLLAHR